MRAAEDCDKVVLKCLDGLFTLVHSVVSGAGQLVCDVGCGEVVPQFARHFVVVAY